ncbi:hypothetical protein PY247_12885 [Acinetobacter proteolyticus]|nr:hypothetical protein [Acinetobacter proteolyticus]WEI17386.1 hypothetical protein PY247_12885 [Acinetobacter proteolyticus]
MSTTRRQVQTPGKAADQSQTEAETPEVNLGDAATEAQKAADELATLQAEGAQPEPENQPPLDGESIDPASIPLAILESLHRIEEFLATGSLSTPVAAKPKKGRFKFIESKGHVWVEE